MSSSADKIAKEFGKQYIFETDGDEYRRIDRCEGNGKQLYYPGYLPGSLMILRTHLMRRNISYEQMKAWELAPTNPAAMEKAGIKFAITVLTDLQNSKDFWTNIPQSHGLWPERKTGINVADRNTRSNAQRER